MAKRLTTEEFIEKAIKVHGDKYDYSETVYVSNKKKVKIICPDHGAFEQIAGDHLRGQGCVKCSVNARRTTEEFIEKAVKVHGDKYDYSEAQYITSREKVMILCPEHGVFEQKANGHLNGKGCPECAKLIRGKAPALRAGKLFAGKSAEVHDNKYDYNEVDYVSNHKKVKIICPDHGVFEQAPGNHMQGAGCPDCRLKTDNDAIYIWEAVGIFSLTGEKVYKIGITSWRLGVQRINDVARGANIEAKIVLLSKTVGKATEVETMLHKDLGIDAGFEGFDGCTEFRILTEEELSLAIELARMA